MYTKETAPILNTLALEYAVFDAHYCSIPGPTGKSIRLCKTFALGTSSEAHRPRTHHTRNKQTNKQTRPTDPNRGFSMSGTSNGMTTNFNNTLWSQQSFFDFLRVRGHTFGAYYQDDPWVRPRAPRHGACEESRRKEKKERE